MTAAEASREAHFRSIVSFGHSGLEAADDLVRQAAKRLDILLLSPCAVTNPETPSSSPGTKDYGYPLPTMTSGSSTHLKPKQSRSRVSSSASLRPPLRRQRSSVSTASVLSTGILPMPVKSTPSSASLVTDIWSPTHLDSPSPIRHKATDSLRRLQVVNNEPMWLSLRDWSVRRKTPRAQSIFPNSPRPKIGTSDPSDDTVTPLVSDVASPAISPPSPPSVPRARFSSYRPATSTAIRPDAVTRGSSQNLPSQLIRPKQSSSSLLLSSQPQIASLDPSFAAAELASALTKHVSCSVCDAKGVNLPECRRCGMRFCGRDCRVGERGAGDGKR